MKTQIRISRIALATTFAVSVLMSCEKNYCDLHPSLSQPAIEGSQIIPEPQQPTKRQKIYSEEVMFQAALHDTTFVS